MVRTIKLSLGRRKRHTVIQFLISRWGVKLKRLSYALQLNANDQINAVYVPTQQATSGGGGNGDLHQRWLVDARQQSM